MTQALASGGKSEQAVEHLSRRLATEPLSRRRALQLGAGAFLAASASSLTGRGSALARPSVTAAGEGNVCAYPGTSVSPFTCGPDAVKCGPVDLPGRPGQPCCGPGSVCCNDSSQEQHYEGFYCCPADSYSQCASGCCECPPGRKCGNDCCREGEICVAGTCVICESGVTCAGACCEEGERCIDGRCVDPCPTGEDGCGLVEGRDLCCPPGWTCCDSRANLCCAPGQICTDGQCKQLEKCRDLRIVDVRSRSGRAYSLDGPVFEGQTISAPEDLELKLAGDQSLQLKKGARWTIDDCRTSDLETTLERGFVRFKKFVAGGDAKFKTGDAGVGAGTRGKTQAAGASSAPPGVVAIARARLVDFSISYRVDPHRVVVTVYKGKVEVRGTGSVRGKVIVRARQKAIQEGRKRPRLSGR